MTDKEKWDLTLAACQAKLPNLKIKYKDEVWHQKLIAKLMFFNRRYPNFTSVLDCTIYFPSKAYVEKEWPWKALQHEFGHAWDGRTLWGLLKVYIPYLSKLFWVIFAVAYLFPAPFPFPAPGRMWAELRMFRRSIELRPQWDQENLINKYTSRFTSGDYFWMWPFEKHIKKLLTSKPSPYRDEMDSWTGR